MSGNEHGPIEWDPGRKVRSQELQDHAAQRIGSASMAAHILYLQRTIGNQAVGRWLHQDMVRFTAQSPTISEQTRVLRDSETASDRNGGRDTTAPLAPDASKVMVQRFAAAGAVLQRDTVRARNGVEHSEDPSTITTDENGVTHDAAGNVVTFSAPDGVWVEAGASSDGGSQQSSSGGDANAQSLDAGTAGAGGGSQNQGTGASAQGGSPGSAGNSGGVTTGEIIVGVLVAAAIIGGIALIVASGGTATPVVLAGMEVAGDAAAGTAVAAGTTVVGEVATGAAADAALATVAADTTTAAATGVVADTAGATATTAVADATGATATAAADATAAGTTSTAATAAANTGVVTAEETIANGLIRAGGKLASVLQAMQAQWTALAPTTAMGALNAIQAAVRSVGLDIGIASMGADGSIILTNVGGVLTTIAANGAVTVVRDGVVLLNLVP